MHEDLLANLMPSHGFCPILHLASS